MGTVVEALAVVRPGRVRHRDALGLADEAVRRCLDRAGVSPTEVGLLVNAGLYREGSLQEPALASLIQEDVQANPGHPTLPGGHGTFSFDVLNGSCGILTGVRVVDGFLTSGAIRYGLVVASDTDPRNSRGYRFPPVGAAVLLRHDPETPGFTDFDQMTFPEFEDLFTSRMSFEERRHGGRNVLHVTERVGYLDRSVACARTAVERFCERRGTAPGDIDLLIANHTSPGFADTLADALALPRDHVAHPPLDLDGAHTAGTVVALEAATHSALYADARTMLFCAAGAGITVALAAYER